MRMHIAARKPSLPTRDRIEAMTLSAVFVTLALAVHAGRTARCDEVIRARLPRKRRGAVLRVAKGIKVVGKPPVQLPLAAVTTYCLRRADVPGAGAVATAALAAFLTDKACKRVVHRRRPPSYRGTEKNRSFPSGHTTATAALTFTLAALLQRHGTLRAPCGTGAAALLTALVGASRLYLDEHWFGDVLAGALLGGAASCGALAASESLFARPRDRTARQSTAMAMVPSDPAVPRHG